MGVTERLARENVYLDANIFIYAIERFPRYVAVARELLRAVDDGAIQAVTSELTLAEVIVGPLRSGRPDLVHAFETALSPGPSFAVVSISSSILRSSAELRARGGGRLPDAIHSATALAQGCTLLLTADRTFKVPGGLRRVLLDDLVEGRRD